MKDARVPRPRRRQEPADEIFDVVSRTAREARLESIARRQRNYFRFMVPAMGCTLFGFFVPAPLPLRLAALFLAVVLGLTAVVLGNFVA
ncbi:MAG: DUF3099 domain-containing protein [Sporichthyaceae bacterium]